MVWFRVCPALSTSPIAAWVLGGQERGAMTHSYLHTPMGTGRRKSCSDLGATRSLQSPESQVPDPWLCLQAGVGARCPTSLLDRHKMVTAPRSTNGEPCVGQWESEHRPGWGTRGMGLGAESIKILRY